MKKASKLLALVLGAVICVDVAFAVGATPTDSEQIKIKEGKALKAERKPAQSSVVYAGGPGSPVFTFKVKEMPKGNVVCGYSYNIDYNYVNEKAVSGPVAVDCVYVPNE